MMTSMRLVTISIFFAFASLMAQDAPPKAPAKGPEPKNLKILKAEEVRPMMGAFRTALGVQCTFCHTMGDFASDENPHKEKARMMIAMMREVNAKFGDNKDHVTCYTCHRGKSQPETAPPAAQ
jgi:hypothetical protein